jgi:hypothetical protein
MRKLNCISSRTLGVYTNILKLFLENSSTEVTVFFDKTECGEVYMTQSDATLFFFQFVLANLYNVPEFVQRHVCPAIDLHLLHYYSVPISNLSENDN